MTVQPPSSLSGVAGLILAAGKGTRMRSEVPKVLHAVAGRSLLAWVVAALKSAGAWPACVVLSEDRDGFAAYLRGEPELRVAVQKNRQGTGDAAAAAAWSFAGVKPAPFAAGYAAQGQPIACRDVLICAGDVPAMRAEELQAFVAAFRRSGATVGVLGMAVADPKGYGRLVTTADGGLEAIVEERDADAATRSIKVCNTGVIIAHKDELFQLLAQLRADNAQREYYLTDIAGHARARGLRAMAHVAAEAQDFAGINDRAQLAAVEGWLGKRLARALQAAGVTLRLPDTIYLEPDVTGESDAEVGPGCRLAGRTRLGAGCRVGANAVLSDVQVGAGAVIGAGAVLERCQIAPGERVPPLSVRLQTL